MTRLQMNGRGRGDSRPVQELDHRPEPLRQWVTGIVLAWPLLTALARKEFRVRYKRASFGILWSVALPVFQSAVMVLIFSRIGTFESQLDYNYGAFVFAGMIPWLYFSSSLLLSTTSIVDSSSITDKVFFPRAILPLVSPVANVVTLAITVVVLLVAIPVLGAPLGLDLVYLLPAMGLVVAFTCAFGLVLGGLYVYFRDLKFLVQAALLVWLYLTPIVYPQSALGGSGAWLDFNPLTGIVGLFQRAAVGAPVPSGRALLVSVCFTFVLLVAGAIGHQKHDRLFVDQL